MIERMKMSHCQPMRDSSEAVNAAIAILQRVFETNLSAQSTGVNEARSFPNWRHKIHFARCKSPPPCCVCTQTLPHLFQCEQIFFKEMERLTQLKTQQNVSTKVASLVPWHVQPTIFWNKRLLSSLNRIRLTVSTTRPSEQRIHYEKGASLFQKNRL